jgi:hypothetical protein
MIASSADAVLNTSDASLTDDTTPNSSITNSSYSDN